MRIRPTAHGQVCCPFNDVQVVICHGFCDHIGRYELMARAFNKIGLACAGLDVEGHGLSRGTRGFIKSWKGVLQDLISFLPHAKTEAEVAPDAPLFVLGHSMGGTFALALADALEQSGTPPSGLVLSAPMVEVDPAVATPFLRAMQGIVNATIPGIVVQQIENERVCNNKAVVADYDEDRAGCPGDVYASTGGELLALVEHVRERVHRMKVPIQVHHADTDALTDYHASKRLLQVYGEGKKMAAPGAATGGAASSEQAEGSSGEGSGGGAPDKEFVSVEDGSGHELMFEKNGPTHLARMCAWVKSRLSDDE